MAKNYYLFSSGSLVRKNNTLFFRVGENTDPIEENGEIAEEFALEDDEAVLDELSESEPKRLPAKAIPVEDIDSLYCFGELRFNSRLMNFLSSKQIPLHFFNYYGYYSGSFYPREILVSGKLLIKQVEFYQQEEKRLALSRKLIQSACFNILKNLQYYNNRERDCTPFIEIIEDYKGRIELNNTIEELMGIEGNIRRVYYDSWHLLITDEIKFERREMHPPTNPVNALISFCNAMVYSTVLSEIYKTQLNPTVSILHQPSERRFSLSLDVAEIFKPLLADRIIFTLLNKRIIQDKHFKKEFNSCYLNDEGRKIVVQAYDEKIKTTIKHRTLKRSVSYKQLVRLECYKLIKHFLEEKEYKPFKIWW